MRTRSRALYLTSNEEQILAQMAKKQGQSKSAIIRQMLISQSLIEDTTNIKAQNKILIELLKQIIKCGYNINQIAYQLNINVLEEQEANNDAKKAFLELEKTLSEVKEVLKDKQRQIKINTKRAKDER